MKKLSNKIFLIVTTLVLIISFANLTDVHAAGSLVNGKYEANIQALQVGNNNESTVEQRLIKPAAVLINDQSATFTIKTTEQLQLSYVVSSEQTVPLVEVGVNTYEFTVNNFLLTSSSESFEAEMSIFVPQAPPAVQNQKFRFLFSNFKLVETGEKEPDSTENKDEESIADENITNSDDVDEDSNNGTAEKTDNNSIENDNNVTTVVNPKTNDSTLQFINYIAASALLLSLATYFYYFRRQRN